MPAGPGSDPDKIDAERYRFLRDIMVRAVDSEIGPHHGLVGGVARVTPAAAMEACQTALIWIIVWALAI